MKCIVIALMSAIAGAAFAGDSTAVRMQRVAKFSDDVCTVSNICYMSSYDQTAIASEFEVDMGDEAIGMKGGYVRVIYVLKPERGSSIVCRLELPDPANWNGRMWGLGNSGYAGVLPTFSNYSSLTKGGAATMTTDCGTAEVTHGGKNNVVPLWPEPVLKDFIWRSTHLMTVYGRKLATLFYGREPKRMYFQGGSCGGRQAMGEVIWYADDYDGVIAHLPHCNVIVSEAGLFARWLMTHDDNCRALCTREQFKAFADAEIEYFSDKSEEPFAGHVLAYGNTSATEVTNCVEFAAEKVGAPFNTAAMKDRMRRMHLPVYHKGRCVFNGFQAGTDAGNMLTSYSIYGFRNWLVSKGVLTTRGELKRLPTWDDYEAYSRVYAPKVNVNDPDLSEFKAHGGKLIITTGWEDQTVPANPIVDFYEQIVERNGGLAKVRKFAKLFICPGCAHGGGTGRYQTGGPGASDARRRLVEWVEDGTDFDSLSTSPSKNSPWRPKENLRIAQYPDFYYWKGGEWQRKTMPMKWVARPDSLYNCPRAAGHEK